MRNLMLCFVAAIFLLCVPVTFLAQAGYPDVRQLQLVARLPPELPQRIMGLAYDGEKLWATIYLGRGRYATLDPLTLGWALDEQDEHSRIIGRVAGAFNSPGGICFAKDVFWIAGAYGESFGSIDKQSWKVQRLFKGKQRADWASQFYSSIAFDGKHLWIAWHWFRYALPVSQTQLLLKVDPETGKVVGEYPLPGGTRNDGTHGLTWDGARLWHMKDSKLSLIEPSTGLVTAQYVLAEIKRPSGLAWVDNALWIAEFEGTIWRLPFASEQPYAHISVLPHEGKR
ncbi:MAG TPA: hypothetical protein VMZ30_04015 [Pyrinomonadaceae bacterium]|nr:hypothetical protein [Pyrinomonadaceae bacterium]